MREPPPDPAEVAGIDEVIGQLMRCHRWNARAPFPAIAKDRVIQGWPRLVCVARREKTRYVILHAALYEREGAWEAHFAFSLWEGSENWTEQLYMEAQLVCEQPQLFVDRVNEISRKPVPTDVN